MGGAHWLRSSHLQETGKQIFPGQDCQKDKFRVVDNSSKIEFLRIQNGCRKDSGCSCVSGQSQLCGNRGWERTGHPEKIHLRTENKVVTKSLGYVRSQQLKLKHHDKPWLLQDLVESPEKTDFRSCVSEGIDHRVALWESSALRNLLDGHQWKELQSQVIRLSSGGWLGGVYPSNHVVLMWISKHGWGLSSHFSLIFPHLPPSWLKSRVHWCSSRGRCKGTVRGKTQDCSWPGLLTGHSIKGKWRMRASGALQRTQIVSFSQGTKRGKGQRAREERIGSQTLLMRTLRALPSFSACSLNDSSNLSFSGSP